MEQFLEKAAEMLDQKPPKPMKQLLDGLGYLDDIDHQLIKKAYVYASIAHDHQSRRTGEPYIHHPLAVARTLAALNLDKESIAAGLLHDVLEDTALSADFLAKEFGKEILTLVDGVSKLDQIEYEESNQAQAENFRKMMLAIVKDIRVILIKLADRLHNIQTLHALEQKKQFKIAKETLQIYAPIANRLGIYQMKTVLEREAFRYAYPWRYKILQKSLKLKVGNQKRTLGTIVGRISKNLKKSGLDVTIQIREKALFSIYNKMKNKKLSFDQVIDVYGLRIIVGQVEECYQALGVVHQIYKPIAGKVKDYIAIPRINGYQSIHTSLLGPNGTPIEVQVRTKAMDKVARTGIAAHWKYKLNDSEGLPPQIKAREWIATIKEIQGTAHPEEFLESIKVDLFPDKIYVFTPKGEILRLPINSTCVDFAYAVHTDVGNSCIGAEVDRVQAPLRTILKSGQTVDIVTSKYSNPDPSWLNFITTVKARHNIRNYLKKLNTAETIALGKRLFNNALEILGKKKRSITKKQIKNLLVDMAFNSMEEFYENIGLGDKNPMLMAQIILGEPEKKTQDKNHSPLLIKGTEGVSMSFPKCCTPIPGDTIIGHLSSQRGLVIHRIKCAHVANFNKEGSRWIGTQWSDDINHALSTEIKVHAMHKPGSLAEVAGTIADKDCNVEQVTISREYEDDTVDILFLIQIKNRQELANVMREIKRMKNVLKVSRNLH
jgi:RelA/SpoT family (p)ppGpp synthetase